MSGTIHSDGPADGLTLRQAWAAGQVTGQPSDDDFPILCKFLDPQDWLSVQVHPDDEQARRSRTSPAARPSAGWWSRAPTMPS